MFAGRSVEAKKRPIRLLFERIGDQLGIAPQDIEITITETPRHNWGIRGVPGDELALGYRAARR
jgi:phenylpyruvate tautomerase PptA (4-oxalocrotonate tautomerase family)